MKQWSSNVRRLCRVLVMTCLTGLIFVPVIVFSASFSPNACGDGRGDKILEDFGSTTVFTPVFKADPSIPDPTLSIVSGCHGQALAFGYDLTNANSNGESWIVLQRTIPVTDLTQFTHIRLALRGSNVNSHENVEIKLWDGHQLYAITLKSMTDLPVWRPIYIDLRELTNVGTINLATISRFEIAVVRCSTDCEVPDVPGVPTPNEHVGTLYLDEFGLVNLKPGTPNRLVETGFESVELNRVVAEAAATAIHTRISSSDPTTGLVPSWFSEPTPNYNTYVQAEALLVFIYEYEQTGSIAYRDAARNLARKLLSLQIPMGKTNAGAWYTSYDQTLQPPYHPLPTPQPCDGNEAMMSVGGNLVANNIDACEWVGNVGWVLIALSKLQRSGLYDDPVALSDALNRGAGWVIGQFGRNPGYPVLISLGIEGNISAYFGLLASGKQQEAAQLGNAIFQFGWDPVQRRMKPGVGSTDAATAMDVSGSWGVTLLRSLGKTQEALDSQGYSATVLRTSSFSGTILGYGDIAGPFTVAIEFTGQAAVAGIKDADFVMRQIYPLQRQPNKAYAGAFPGAADHWYGGSLPPWNTTMPGVSPTAWVYFAASCIDPLREAYLCKVYLPVILK
ncbi:MAG: hypothetical protein BroJett011_17840 [Chloroflexota bacterium]|nr:MAG: hypothetical protein BroJett011_17840 [Chloroflexota bacterium]